MTDTPAAIKGTFTKLTAVSTRKVAVLHIEVPIEKADATMQALGGFPDPANPVWVAVALLDPSVAPEAAVEPELHASALPETEHKTFADEPEKRRGGRLSQQAAMCCDDPRFWSFCFEKEGFCFDPLVAQGPQLAEFVRNHCEIQSRAELDHDEAAAARWNQLHAEFLADGGLGQ